MALVIRITLQSQGYPAGLADGDWRFLESLPASSDRTLQLLWSSKFAPSLRPSAHDPTKDPSIGPGNYATHVAAGASTKFALLFVVFMSDILAIFLQSLYVKLGAMTGLNLVESYRAYLTR